jgi:hypothetical protein
MAEVQQEIATLGVLGRELVREKKITLLRLHALAKELQQAETAVKEVRRSPSPKGEGLAVD